VRKDGCQDVGDLQLGEGWELNWWCIGLHQEVLFSVAYLDHEFPGVVPVLWEKNVCCTQWDEVETEKYLLLTLSPHGVVQIPLRPVLLSEFF
jgi:hypothetical protein